MILYIREEIKIKIKEEDIEEDNILQECTVLYDYKDGFIIIREQKVVLDEFKMNELFDEVFSEYDIEYGYYGGAGCEFSISVYARP